VTAVIRWLGHATVVVELGDARFVTDPVLRQRVLHLRRERPVEPPADVDAVLISHLHYDHLDRPSLASIGVDTPIVVPRGGRAPLKGFEQVTEVEPGTTLELAGVRVRVVEAVHDGRRHRIGGEVPAVGYILEGERTVYFAGDTDLFDGMRSFGELDLALVPIWGWGRSVGKGHLDPLRAARALSLLEPRIAVPIHWGTYSATWARPAGRAPAERFVVAALEEAPRVDVRVLPVGGTLEVS
jgi:L-ascorbate metabolism protein UlaG (beta-lactamase superfamily)